MQYSITLQAGVEKRQQFGGKTLVVLDTGVAVELLSLIVEVDGFGAEELRNVRRGLKLQAPGFSGARFVAPVDCTIEVIVSNANVSVNYQEGSTVNVNVNDLPLPVATTRGDAPVNPFFVTGLTYSDTPAASNANAAPVAVGAAAVQVAAAAANVLQRRFVNNGPDPAAIGAAGITWANRVIVLDVGDVWVEEKGAPLAWYAITAGGAAAVTVQELRA